MPFRPSHLAKPVRRLEIAASTSERRVFDLRAGHEVRIAREVFRSRTDSHWYRSLRKRRARARRRSTATPPPVHTRAPRRTPTPPSVLSSLLRPLRASLDHPLPATHAHPSTVPAANPASAPATHVTGRPATADPVSGMGMAPIHAPRGFTGASEPQKIDGHERRPPREDALPLPERPGRIRVARRLGEVNEGGSRGGRSREVSRRL